MPFGPDRPRLGRPPLRVQLGHGPFQRDAIRRWRVSGDGQGVSQVIGLLQRFEQLKLSDRDQGQPPAGRPV